MPAAERRLLLLDREGTVLRSPPGEYVLSWDDVALQDGAVETIVQMGRSGFVPVIVTNQSCVNRGLTTLAWVEEVNAWLAEQVRAAGGGDLPARVCPHIDADQCACRKPKPGMVLDAARLTGLPVETAWYVGDSPVDLGAARAAGVERFLHVCGPRGPAPCEERDVECLRRFQDLAALASSSCA